MEDTSWALLEVKWEILFRLIPLYQFDPEGRYIASTQNSLPENWLLVKSLLRCSNDNSERILLQMRRCLVLSHLWDPTPELLIDLWKYVDEPPTNAQLPPLLRYFSFDTVLQTTGGSTTLDVYINMLAVQLLKMRPLPWPDSEPRKPTSEHLKIKKLASQLLVQTESSNFKALSLLLMFYIFAGFHPADRLSYFRHLLGTFSTFLPALKLFQEELVIVAISLSRLYLVLHVICLPT